MKKQLILDDIPSMAEEEIYSNKIEVTEISIISRMITDRPYYSIKYTKANTGETFVGYSSYKFENVMYWKRMYFKLVQEKESNMKSQYEVIRVEHPNGYSGVLYGESSMSISKDGKEVLHTGFRNKDINSKEKLYEQLEKMPRLMEVFRYGTLWEQT